MGHLRAAKAVTPGPRPAAAYAIRGGEEGKRRLDLLAGVLADSTRSLLMDAGLTAGMRCADVGCGGGHVTRVMGELVGDSGRAVGMDLDAVKIANAAGQARSAGTSNVEFRVQDLNSWNERAEYDFVYGRFILSHLPDRVAVLQRMRDSLVDGGTIAVEDVDFTGHFSHPPNAAFERYSSLYRELIGRRGGDADLGPKLPAMMAAAGLTGVRMRIVQPVHSGNEPGKAMALSTLLNIGDALLVEDIVPREELDRTIAELTALTEDPTSVISLPRVFQVWGRVTQATLFPPACTHVGARGAR